MLSRVESAVQNGDIPKAMELIATLPEVAQAEMADWLILARTRVDVLAALDGLLPSNGSTKGRTDVVVPIKSSFSSPWLGRWPSAPAT